MGQVRYSEQFKRETVRLVIEEGYNANRAAESVGVSGPTVRAWVRRYAAEAPQQVAYASEADELAQLREENRRLRMERDILKKAAAFFAKETA
jgi:transposase